MQAETSSSGGRYQLICRLTPSQAVAVNLSPPLIRRAAAAVRRGQASVLRGGEARASRSSGSCCRAVPHGRVRRPPGRLDAVASVGVSHVALMTLRADVNTS